MNERREAGRMGSAPQHEQVDLPALANRAGVLSDLGRVVAEAWASFDAPRPREPELDEELVRRLGEPLPEGAGDAESALADAARVLDASVSPSRPLFLGYIGSTGLEMGVLASALSATYDVNLATAAGGADLVEEQALRWLAQFVGFPLAEGAFTSGGMASNLTAMLAARERALPGSRVEGVGGHRAAVYCSEEAHHSVVRAVEVCGLGSGAVRRIPVDGRHRMETGALEEALSRDISSGVVPVAVVATAGTTLTGAVDPIAEIAEACGRYGVWLHVDGAYGLPAAAAPETAPLFSGVELADSATVDAHKWLGVQKSCSAVLLREAGRLRAAFGHEESYMPHAGDVAHPVDRTLEYSRPLRSLRLWMAFRVHGAAQYRVWIGKTLENARRLADLLREDPEFELLHEPMLSVVCFRHTPAGVEDLDAHNLDLARAMQRDGRVYLAPANLDGRICLRVCFVNFRTTPEEVARVPEVAGEIGRRLARRGG
ncbi:MAG: aminotransferase class V-fold PLP-dependent enzyme [Rubrobacteraceae bacterium]|nr:aminotransferase class V-fold PLP-dependent enzyme [Rubrobacteraceae bacterium]